MEKVKVFLLGALTALCFLLLLGMSNNSQDGRYQITSHGDQHAGWVYVVDTRTGVVKLVQTNTALQVGVPFEKTHTSP